MTRKTPAPAVTRGGRPTTLPITPALEDTVTSTRILGLMALMRDIEKPSACYNRAVRRAWQTLTDSPENDAAQARGNAALLEIEQAVRAWVAKHPDPEVRRNEIRQSYSALAAQAEQDRDHEGAAELNLQLREREEQWKRDDAA